MDIVLNCSIILITFFAFLIRITALFLLGRHIRPELWEYDKIAYNLIHNNGYAIEHLNTIHRSYIYPVYPLISAFFRLYFRNGYFFQELFQIILSSAACYVIFLIANRIFDRKTGLLASFLVAVHPGLIIYSTKIHEVTLVYFLIAVIFYLIICLDWTKDSNNLLIGVLIGIGILTRPTIVLLLPVFAFCLWLRPIKKRYILKVISIASLSAALVILPWTIRNFWIHKKWIFITTTSAQQFWMGNNPWASGSGLSLDGQSVLGHAPDYFFQKLYKMNEIEQYNFFRQQAFSFIKSHPVLSFKMLIKKFFYFWWFSPQAGKLYPQIWKDIYSAYYAVFLVFFILGSWLCFKSPDGIYKAGVIAMLLLFLGVAFLHSVYYVEIRHRWSIEPLMCVFSAYGFKRVVEKII